jgi:hypothetical protein
MLRAQVASLASEYRFFHWQLEFPDVFAVPDDLADAADQQQGWTGGFTCILANPPWEHTELKEQEYFASRDPEIAVAAGAARKKLIAILPATNADLWASFSLAKRLADGVSHLARSSGRFPLCGRGRINTYALFAETARALLSARGRVGIIVPTGIATDATTQYFFRDVVANGSLASLYDFLNNKELFDSVATNQRFCLLTLVGRGTREAAAEFAFFAHDPADLAKPEARFFLGPDEITLLNPNTGTSPIFRTRRDAEITLSIYRRVPIFLKENDTNGDPWGVSIVQGVFNMTSDSHLFHGRDELIADGWTLHGNTFSRGDDRMLPLYQGMMTTFFDHRAADVALSATATKRQSQPSYLSAADREDPRRFALPAHWVSHDDVPDDLPSWLLGFSSITSPMNARTFVPVALPRAPVGNSFPLIMTQQQGPVLAGLLAACSSFVVDYCARQKIGGTNLNFFYVLQFPILSPATYGNDTPWQPGVQLSDWIADRVLELVFTAWDMGQFARDIGDAGPPFHFDQPRRVLMRAELDAAYFHLYGVAPDDVGYILDTFPVVRRKDEAAFGEYRTKRLIVEIYEAMVDAVASGSSY